MKWIVGGILAIATAATVTRLRKTNNKSVGDIKLNVSFENADELLGLIEEAHDSLERVERFQPQMKIH